MFPYAWLSFLLLACSSAPQAETETETEPETSEAPAEEEALPADCDALRGQAEQEFSALNLTGGSCEWDGECLVRVPNTDGCCSPPVAVPRDHVQGWDRAIGPSCEHYAHEDCVCALDPVPHRAVCRDGTCVPIPVSEELTIRDQERSGQPYPPHNRPLLADPPPRPGPGTAEERARRLFEAIKNDDANSVEDFFFPRDAFLLVKAIDDPGAYHDRLLARYRRDVHDLHESLGLLPAAEFLRLELVRRGGWVPVGEEGNRLPYWVSRHSWIHYREGDQEKKFEVRVLITWDDEWFITHLNEFH